MYKLDRPFVDGALKKNDAGSVNTDHTLNIRAISDIPKELQRQLVKIN
jgi:hypothetical protein